MAMDLFQGSGRHGRNENPAPRQRNEINEKNYFFLGSNQLPRISLREAAAGEAGKSYFGKLLLGVTALQDLFLGSGEVEDHNQQLYDTFSYFKQETEPPARRFTLPGSSLKGCTLTNLCLFLDEPSLGFFSASAKHDSADMAKVFFSDFPISHGSEGKPQTIPGRFTPRLAPPPHTRLKLYRKDDLAYGSLTPGELREVQAKENLLTVERGNQFRGFINFKLLTLHELLFLVMSLGCCQGHRFCFKVGGAKNRGMGLVKIELDLEKSFYATGIKELGLGKHRSLAELESQWLAALDRLKQRHSRIHQAVEIMQKEYGVPS